MTFKVRLTQLKTVFITEGQSRFHQHRGRRVYKNYYIIWSINWLLYLLLAIIREWLIFKRKY